MALKTGFSRPERPNSRAVVARPGSGPPQTQWARTSAGKNRPRRTNETPPIDGAEGGCGQLPAARRDEGRAGPPSRRRRRISTPAGPRRGGITHQPAPTPSRLRGSAFIASRAYSQRRAVWLAPIAPREGAMGSRACSPTAEKRPDRRRAGDGARSLPPLRPPGRSGPRARRKAGPDLRRCDGGALVARPGPGSAQSHAEQGSAGKNNPEESQNRPPVAEPLMGVRTLSPLRAARPDTAWSLPFGGPWAPPRRRRSIGSPTGSPLPPRRRGETARAQTETTSDAEPRPENTTLQWRRGGGATESRDTSPREQS